MNNLRKHLIMSTIFQRIFSSQVLKVLSIAIIYFVLARFSLLMALGKTNASPVWPPSGFAFAVILMLGYRVWPGIYIGAFIGNVVVFYTNKAADLQTILLMSAFIALGNSLEALTGHYLLRLFNSNQILDKAKDFARFFITTLLMCTVSCTIGTMTTCIGHLVSWTNYGTVWFTWWMGDVASVIVLTPLLLTWWIKPKIKWETTLQIVASFGILCIYLLALFGGWFMGIPIRGKTYLIFIILIWCVFIMNQRQSSLIVLLISIFSIWGTLNGKGPFIEISQNESLLELQIFICVAAITMMFLSTTLIERKKSEEDLVNFNVNLEKKVVERTKIIERSVKDAESFAYIVSHDLKEPLRTIASYLQLLEQRNKSKLDKEANEFIAFAVDGAKRMYMLINDLLSYLDIGQSEPTFKEVDFKKVMGIVEGNLHSSIVESNASIVLETEMPIVKADFTQMVQLFQNIISNAIKYKGPQAPEIRIAANRNGNYWLFSVKDNGIGIDGVYHQQIFGIFKRLHTREKYEGTGIGLALCKKIVERHNGRIWVDSEIGKGSTFYFTL